MDKLKLYDKRIENIDREMSLLLEKRMHVVAKAAEYKWINGVHTRKQKKEEDVVEKAATLACEIDLLAYNEGLIEYMEGIGLKYEKKIMRELDFKRKHHN